MLSFNYRTNPYTKGDYKFQYMPVNSQHFILSKNIRNKKTKLNISMLLQDAEEIFGTHENKCLFRARINCGHIQKRKKNSTRICAIVLSQSSYDKIVQHPLACFLLHQSFQPYLFLY